MEIINIRNSPEYLEIGIKYFQSKWANEDSNPVYRDSISRSIVAKSPLPIWYLLIADEEVIGCCGIITNDFISSSDLYPWLCALYIEDKHRGRSYGKRLIENAIIDTKKMGFDALYLCTDLDGYYEKYGFKYITDGYHPWGEKIKVYEIII